MRPSHPKNLTFDQNTLKKILEEPKPQLDDDRVLRRLTLNRNDSNLGRRSFTRPDQSPMTDRPHYRDENTPIMRDNKHENDFEARTPNHSAKDIYSSLYAEIEQLKKDNKSLRLREQKHMTQINSLERERKSLVALLEQSEKNLQDSIKKNKQETKRMNAVVDSFRRSLQNIQSQSGSNTPKEDKGIQAGSSNLSTNFDGYGKGNFSFQTSCFSPPKQTESNDFHSVYVEYIAELFTKFQCIESYAQDLIKSNTQLSREVESLKSYNGKLEEYIHMNKALLIQAAEENNNKREISQLEAEISLYKSFVKDLAATSTTKSFEESIGFTNSSGYSGSKYGKFSRSSSLKPVEKPQKQAQRTHIPSYLKALSLTTCLGNT